MLLWVGIQEKEKRRFKTKGKKQNIERTDLKQRIKWKLKKCNEESSRKSKK